MIAETGWEDGMLVGTVTMTPADEVMGREEGEAMVVARPERVTLLSAVLSGVVAGCPRVEVMGARLVVLLEGLCPGLIQVSWGKVEAKLLREVMGFRLVGGAGEVTMEDRWRIGEMLVGRERSLLGLGKRVSLLAYMLETGEERVAALPCMEALGALWKLRAKNKRSAICAAMMAIQAEMDKSELRLRDHETTVLWFQKRRVTRAKYQAAQVGNQNRRAKGEAVVMEEADDGRGAVGELVEEVFEMVGRVRVRSGPLPIKPQFQGLTAGQLRARLDALHEAAERRRLGV